MRRMRIGVLLRVKNGAATLPAVLAALHAQSQPPARILGIDNGSTDATAAILRSAGADSARWDQPYRAAMVLNHGCGMLADCPLILVVSAHTVIVDRDALARLAAGERGVG
jgi:glycosyltransferase involved in cell wall biosynthesis